MSTVACWSRRSSGEAYVALGPAGISAGGSADLLRRAARLSFHRHRPCLVAQRALWGRDDAPELQVDPQRLVLSHHYPAPARHRRRDPWLVPGDRLLSG